MRSSYKSRTFLGAGFAAPISIECFPRPRGVPFGEKAERERNGFTMSNNQATIEDLIDEMYDVLDKGWKMPLSAGKNVCGWGRGAVRF